MNNTNSRHIQPIPSRTGELVAWCFGYVVIGALTILGNSVTIAVFMKRNFQRKKLHYLLINLAITDLTVGAISVPIQIAILAADIQKTELALSVYQAHFFFDVLSGLASMYSVAFIAVERLVAISWSLKHRMLNPWHYATAIAIPWIIGTIAAVVSRRILPGHVGSLEALNVRTTFAVIAVVITIIAYCLLLLIRQKQGCSKRDERYNRSVACTLLIVTVVFVCTWSPFILLTSIVGYVSFRRLSQCCSLTMDKLILALDLTKLLQYSNSCVNPFIYAFRIKSFRAKLWEILLFGKLSRSHPLNLPENVSRTSTGVTSISTRSESRKTNSENEISRL